MSTTMLDPSAYDSRAGVPIAVVTVCLAVATVCVAMRVYSRAVLIHQFGMDDWAAVIALLLAIGSGSMVASNTIYGAGHHIAVVDQTLLWKYFRTFYISIVLYNGSLTATKIAFLLQYYRVLTTKKMQNIILIALAFISLWSISQLLVVIFTCTPIEKFWLGDAMEGTCVPNLPFWYINAAGNIITDVVIFVVPLPALGSLNLRKTQKLLLIAIFSLGFFTCAISIIRVQYLHLSDDVTWDNVASSCWSVGEICSGITCACLPTLRPLLSKCVPSMRSPSGNGSSGRGYHQKSSGRDGTSERSRAKTTDSMSGSSRAIIYPEDLELQATDSEERPNQDRLVGLKDTLGSGSQYNGARDKLGLRPTVRTEVSLGSPHLGPDWSSQLPTEGHMKISVKHDFTMTKEYKDSNR
ncbi:hypothetical protein B0T17DRAFT_245961 [Bombardia bombarda]|uniref:Rhodopsin domain-containing protein n=1 Tax=Bombardia bombarda TaxID=252184 RepID=A0AA39X0G6_9PEZI|nr:hypothetical protein B0T17DRAFT_245961 [Bombardia bombarda]